MQPVFDLEKLRSLLSDFYELTHIRITVFDSGFHELTACPEKRSAICEMVRASLKGEAACRACDRAACARAANLNQADVYRCHMGLTEAILPFYVERTLAGYLLFGQVLSYPSLEDAWRALRRSSAALPIDSAQLKALCLESPLIPESYIYAAAHILHAVASYLILEKIALLKEDKIAERLDRCLNARFAENLTVQSLCQTLEIGRTQLYTLSKQLYHCGIAQRIRQLRMEKAKGLLVEQPNLRVSEIAFACGFEDYNYFISVFSRQVGVSPGRYRKEKL